MRKVLALAILVLLVAGCKSSFKSNFRDFNAYYNTFYNAKKSYGLGLEKSKAQDRNYNPLQPIRIHQTPLGAGAQEFQNAIDKGADILRKYDETKWVDDALLIIGKSYFYRREYFSAEQKFNELYLSTDNAELKQEAVFWKGRVLLELEANSRGVQYLTDELAAFEGAWKGRLEARIKAVLAEHYVARRDFVNALDLLSESVHELPEKEHKERGYFLTGQLNELLDNPEAAFEAYEEVDRHYTDYDLQFEAQKKKAEVARILGKPGEAYKVFSSMVRDDKNTEFIAELNYELGKTELERDNYIEAESIFKKILNDRLNQPEAVTRAQVYNSLAELNRFHFNDFKQAAAYYDSARQVNAPAMELPEDFSADENAKSFGEYAQIKSEISRKDSLLRLGMLPEAEFDSVLKVLEQQKREELARLQKEQEQRRNTLINVDSGDEDIPGGNSAENGFLNYKNPVLLAQAAQQFSALWNNRPLADNWRVSQLLVAQVQSATNENETEDYTEDQEGTDILVNIDLSDVPFTPQEQDSVQEDIAELHYELANLFFLSLNLPDSAEFYFNKVLEERPQGEAIPVTLYSLSELNSIQDEEQKAIDKAQELVRRFPESVYARRVNEKYELKSTTDDQLSALTPRQEYLLINTDPFLTDPIRVQRLRAFEAEHRGSPIAEKALFDAIKLYIRLGKQEEGFRESYRNWQESLKQWEQKQEDFKALRDSAKAMVSDTMQTQEDSTMYASVLDSVLSEPDFKENFPYRGVQWDSARAAIDVYLTGYPDGSSMGAVRTLGNELSLPAEDIDEKEEIPAEPSEQTAGYSEYIPCTSIRRDVTVRGGMDDFISEVEIPENTEEESIRFLFYINERGIIDEFKLASENSDQKLIDTFIRAIDEGLVFEPLLVEGQARKVQCEVSFPVAN